MPAVFPRTSGTACWLPLAALILLAVLTPSAPRAADVPVAVVAPEVVVLPLDRGTDIRFRRTRLVDGLSQTRVAQIVQDDRGFLWFGTQHGLNRFDGRDYRLFKHEAGNPGSLSGVFIYALFKARDGALWVGSDQGLDVYDPDSETFRHVRIDADNPVVNHVSQDETGILWLATVQGLYRLDPTSGAVRRYVNDPGQPASLASNDVKSSGLDREGRFWVATGEGLEAFDRPSGRVTLRIPIKESVREFFFHEDRTGTFWIVYGSGNGLAQYDRATNTLTRFVVQGGEAGGTGLTGIYAILEDHQGTIWLGTMGEGLLRYDRERRALTAYRHDPGSVESLAENRIIALFEDSQQNIWVGLHASPPNSFPAVKLPFERVVTPIADPKALGETLVNTVFTDSTGVLWVGAGGTLGRIDRASGTSRPVPLGEGAVEVLTIREHPAGTLWVGTLGRGLFRVDTDSGAVRQYRSVPGEAGSLASDLVTRIFVDKAGTLWLATWNGLSRFDPSTGLSTTFKRNPLSAAEGYFSIAQDPSGDLWLGSTSGLYRFSPATGAFRGYTHDAARPGTLSNNTVNTVLVDASGTLWVGTQNGLNRFDRARERFDIFGKADGLPGDVVSCLLDERPGVLWMSTNNGIARLEPATMAFSSFSIADGLPGNDLSGWNACHRAPSGEMVFGGFSGATAFRPDLATQAEARPHLGITEVRRAGVPVSPSGRPRGGSDGLPALQVPSDRNEFSIAYAALCFRNPEGVRYRYRLAGLDAGWNEVGSDRRVASYTAVPAGTYRFEVQARTGRSPWSDPAEAMTVHVLPPWWDTWWFRLAGLAAAVAACFGIYRIRLAQIDHQYAIRLDERVMERTRIARDIHDSLLQGFQGLILRMQAIRNLLPERAAEAGAMLDLALERADAAVTEGREKVVALRSTAGLDMELSEALASLRDELEGDEGERPQFDLVVEGRPRRVGPLVRDEVYQVVREAIRNAVRHGHPRRIEVELSFGRKNLVTRVRDDGVGMDGAVADAGREGHWGLQGMRERAARVGGRLAVWSQPGAGTEVEITVPGGAAYGRGDAATTDGRT